jgi:hypothetical protein
VSEHGGQFDRSRRTLLAGSVALAMGLAGRHAAPAPAAPSPAVTVYKGPT